MLHGDTSECSQFETTSQDRMTYQTRYAWPRPAEKKEQRPKDLNIVLPIDTAVSWDVPILWLSHMGLLGKQQFHEQKIWRVDHRDDMYRTII